MFDFETFRGLNHTEIGARYKYNPDRLIAELQRKNLLVVQGCPTHRSPGAAIYIDKYYTLRSKIKQTKRSQLHKIYDFF